MDLRPDQLVRDVTADNLKPIYLIASPEPLLVIEAADAVRAAARAAGVDGRDVFDASDRSFEWLAVERAAQSMGLFSSRKLIEVTVPTTRPGKDGAAFIEAYCAAPPEGMILVLTGHEWSKKHEGKWVDAIKRVGVLSTAWALKPHEVPGWIESRMRSRKVQADRDAVLQMATRTEGNLLAAAQEIDKLALLAPGERIDSERMERLVADAARFDVFRLIDATFNGDAGMVSRMIAGLQGEGQAVPGLVPMLSKELQLLASVALQQTRSGPFSAQALRNMGVWDAKQAQFKRALDRYPAARWQGLLAELGRLERASKGRGSDDPWLLLERVLLAAADKRAQDLVKAHA